jgi:hypothetical protein
LYTVQETSDKSIIAAGRSSSFGAGAVDIYLIKNGKNGNVLWRKAIGGTGDETANEIKQTFDKGFIIVGNTYSFGAGSNDFYIVKTDSVGSLLWTKTIGSNLNDNAYSVFETYNKDLVVAGLTTEASIDAMIARLDKNGTIKWVNKYGNGGDDRANSIIENNSRELIINGLYNGQDVLMFKTDSMGAVLWAKSYGGSGTDWGFSVKQLKDKNLLFCGYQNLPTFGDDYLLVKTDQLGQKIWAKNFGNTTKQYATNVEEFFDKSIVLTGYSQIAATDYNYFIVKSDSMGKTLCTNRNASITVADLTLTGSPKIYTVSSGGTVSIGSQTNTSFCEISVLCQGALTGLSEISTLNSYFVYPNPSSGLLFIGGNVEGMGLHVEVVNTVGSVVLSREISSNEEQIDLSNLEKGIYFLNVSTNSVSHEIQKLVLY